MTELRHAIALFLVLNVLVGLVRVARGPSFADRMLAALLFGTTGVAVLLLLAADRGAGALRDVALVFSLLASVSVVAFVRLARTRDGGSG
jgi:multicomponent Na+:H+ antiporter subunit F